MISPFFPNPKGLRFHYPFNHSSKIFNFAPNKQLNHRQICHQFGKKRSISLLGRAGACGEIPFICNMKYCFHVSKSSEMRFSEGSRKPKMTKFF
eukprot:UN24059